MKFEDWKIINKALSYSEVQLEELVRKGDVEVAQEKLDDVRKAKNVLIVQEYTAQKNPLCIWLIRAVVLMAPKTRRVKF